MRDVLMWAGRSGRRIAVTIVGFSLVALGLVLLVVPGPGILAILAGLAVLASEYAWARRALREARRRAQQARDRVRPNRAA